MKTAERDRGRRSIRALRWLAEVLLPPHRLMSRIARYELGTSKKYARVRIQVMSAAREVFGVPGKNKEELLGYCPSLIEGGGAIEDDRHRALCVLGLLQTRKSKWSYWRKKKAEEMALLRKLMSTARTNGGRRKVVCRPGRGADRIPEAYFGHRKASRTVSYTSGITPFVRIHST